MKAAGPKQSTFPLRTKTEQTSRASIRANRQSLLSNQQRRFAITGRAKRQQFAI